jgi:acyl-CoA oxidase
MACINLYPGNLGRMNLADNLRTFLDGPDAAIRNTVRAWLSLPGNAPAFDLPLDEHRAQVLAWAKELAEAGGTAIGYPVEYGGEGEVGRSIAAFETLAFGDLSLLVKCGVQFGLFGGAVLHLGTARHHERYLRAIARMELPGCFAMTETAHGSNVQALGTTATYDHEAGEIVVHTPDASARKDYIGNAARDGRMAAVFAQLIVGGEERGVHALLVPLRDEHGRVLPGITIEDCGPKLGLDGVDNGRIAFDRVRVPRHALLDRYAQVRDDGTYFSPIENPTKRFFVMLGTLIQGRVSICGASISSTKVALDRAVRHALARRQFGPPGGEEVLLMDYRTHQRRLLPALATTYGLHFAQERLVARLHEVFTAEDVPDRKRRELETIAAGLKAVASWHATETIQACREACGGAGYLRANRFAALKADTDVFTTFEGDNTVLLQLAAKNLLTDYRDQLGELDPLGVASFFAGQVIGTIAERTAVRKVLSGLAADLLPGRDARAKPGDEAAGRGRGELLDREEQLGLLRWRQAHILQGVARRLKGGIDSGRPPFDVLVDCQDHVVAAARAWVDVVVLEAFADAVERCDDDALRPVLDRLCSLYALSRVEAERGWHQEHGRLTAARSKAVIKAVNALCAELRPDARLLVDGFGVPEPAGAAATPALEHAA